MSPSGRPFIMYHNPEAYEAIDYLHFAVPDPICDEICKKPSNGPVNEDLCNLCIIIMTEENLTMPKDAFTAVDLYLFLKSKLTNLLKE